MMHVVFLHWSPQVTGKVIIDVHEVSLYYVSVLYFTVYFFERRFLKTDTKNFNRTIVK